MLTYFLLLFTVNAIPFWAPELGWGGHFLFTFVMAEFLSGVHFPLDILPINIQNILYLTPFPYLIFFPLQIYLGKITGIVALRGILISSAWIIGLWLLMNKIWKKGFKAYQAYGR